MYCTQASRVLCSISAVLIGLCHTAPRSAYFVILAGSNFWSQYDVSLKSPVCHQHINEPDLGTVSSRSEDMIVWIVRFIRVCLDEKKLVKMVGSPFDAMLNLSRMLVFFFSLCKMAKCFDGV